MTDNETRYWEGHAAGRAENINERIYAEQHIASLDTIQTRMRRLTYAWVLICSGLLAGVVILNLNNIHLRKELAKPPRLTMQQRHEIIKAYLAVGENRWALKQQIGCTDKE